MLISKNWLDTMVEIPDGLEAFCDRLDLTGTGVEGVERTGAKLDGIVVGHILTRDKHPNADTLWVTTVDVGEANVGKDGTPEPLQIVCGAQNFVAGDKVPVATIGTVMPDGNKIKKSKLRGIVSCGMNCSGRELGISGDHEGLLILPEDAPVGMPIADYLGIGDTVIDVEITPNRPDCLSMLGMAREVGAMYDTGFTPEHYELTCGTEDVNRYATVGIEDPERCPRYTARVIKDVKVGPSPDWLAQRVSACGARPINNIVDITNYILFLFGQPLHAFDFDKLKAADGKAHIIVRAAREGEPFTTLDGQERILTSDMTVIADGERPIALAGVMGGLDSEVTEETVNVLLESATFSTSHTSRTSRNLSLISESSLRYERGVDASTCEEFSAQAAALIAELCGGEVCEGVIDVYPVVREPLVLTFRHRRCCDLLGAPVPAGECVRILTRLGCTVDEVADGVYEVIVPTYRPDLEREIDLYEEILRLWGMEKVEPTLPGGRERIGGRSEEQVRQAQIGSVLRACGLNETQTYSFCPVDDLSRLRMSDEGRGLPVELINPMSSEQGVMRQSIIPGLLRSVAYNQSRGVANVQLYENGKVFFATEGHKSPKERRYVSAVMCGSWVDEGWNQPAFELGFYDAKGIVETLLRELAVKKVHFKALEGEAAGHLQPGRAAAVLAGGTTLGWIGEIHPLALAAFEVTGPVAAFELDEQALIRVACEMRDYQEVPRFPAVEVDLALVVDEGVTSETLERAITSAGGKLLESVRLFDVYRDEKRLGAGRKSLAFALTYRQADRTLTSEEVEHQHERIVKKVCGKTGAEVRS